MLLFNVVVVGLVLLFAILVIAFKVVDYFSNKKKVKDSVNYSHLLQDSLDRRSSELTSMRVANKHLYELLQACYIILMPDKCINHTVEDYDSIPAQLKEYFSKLINENDFLEKENSSLRCSLINLCRKMNQTCTEDTSSELLCEHAKSAISIFSTLKVDNEDLKKQVKTLYRMFDEVFKKYL